MKTRFYTLYAALLLASAPVLACGDSTACRIPHNDSFKFWKGLDIGVNGYYNAANSLTNPEGYNFLELDYARSRSIAWNMGQYNFHIVKNYVNLVTGLGIEWNSYALRNNVSLQPHASEITGIEENHDFTKNKLKSTWLNAPLMLEFNTSKNENHSFHIGVGAEFGYNIFRNRLKQEFSINGDEQKRKVKDDFNINPFRYSLTARVGYGKYTVFANYGMSTLFKANQGPKVYPFSAGISINLD
ncbi:MAG TPA: outer membrane beta-barrel protein [Bacteroidia bacterium]|nr:outer membrane beta-barrel protein [Bacteroidia bacterium]